MPQKSNNMPPEVKRAIETHKNWQVGQTFRHMHGECSWNKPNPKAMAIIKKTDGYYFFCFRCGFKGFAGNAKKSPAEMREQLKNLEECKEYEAHNTIQLPPDCIQMTSNRPKDIPWVAYQWAWKCDITGEMMEKYDFKWSEAWQRVIIPIYEWTTKTSSKILVRKLIGWVGREVNCRNKKVREEHHIAKYITHKSSEYKRIFFHAPVANCNKYVLVEDVLSAIKVREYAGVNAIALLTTSIPTRVLVKMRSRDLILWLDFDALSSTLKYFTKARRWGGTCRYIRTSQDPKWYDEEFIKDIVNDEDRCDLYEETEEDKKPFHCPHCNLTYSRAELIKDRCPMDGYLVDRNPGKRFFCGSCGAIVTEKEMNSDDKCPVCNRSIDDSMELAV